MKDEQQDLDPREIGILESIGSYLDESNDDRAKRLAKIDALADRLVKFLEFEKRVTELTDVEKQNYYRCLDGNILLTDEMKVTLDSCTTDERREYYTKMWARSIYFARCAWETYLRTGKDKPYISQKALEMPVQVLTT